nr:uroporphyrinogen decarboxylase family protein [bacterium]
MRFDREEYLALMTFTPGARPMLCELFGPLVGLEQEWVAQGATPQELSLEAFGLDYVPLTDAGGNTGLFGAPAPRVLEDTPEYTLSVDSLGRRTKLIKTSASIPLPLEYPVTCMEDWLKIKPMYAFDPARIDVEGAQRARRLQQQGYLVLTDLQGGYNTPRELMGDEGLCLAYYDQPELVHDMLETFADTACRVFERLCDIVVPDVLHVHEDMAGSAGPLIGPGLVREFIAPYYKKVWGLLSERGTTLFSQDSDGFIAPLLDDFMACGVNTSFPAEPGAGMDMVQLREKYGTRLGFKGGIDKHVLKRGTAQIDAELAYKLQPSMQTGTIFGLDHRIPNGTPLAAYRHYIATAKELLGRKADEPPCPHVRMAF